MNLFGPWLFSYSPCGGRDAHSRQRIPLSALSPNVTSALRFSRPSGRIHLSRVAICRPQEAHCSGSCLMQ